jgi:hypothetical protein
MREATTSPDSAFDASLVRFDSAHLSTWNDAVAQARRPTNALVSRFCVPKLAIWANMAAMPDVPKSRRNFRASGIANKAQIGGSNSYQKELIVVRRK